MSTSSDDETLEACHVRRIELNLELESRRFQSYWESHGGGGGEKDSPGFRFLVNFFFNLFYVWSKTPNLAKLTINQHKESQHRTK